MPAISKILVCNRALYKVGSERITSFTDGSKAAGIFSEIYDELRDEVNEAGQWKFSRAEATLNQLSVNPSSSFDYAFQLPADCLKVRATSIDPSQEWTLSGDRVLLANDNAVDVVYTKQVTDEGQFSKHAIEALVCRLGMDIAFPLTGKTDLIEVMAKEFERALSLGRTFDSQSGGKPKNMRPSTWTRARL